MKASTKMGIWLDHTIAYLFDISDSNAETLTIKADNKHHEIKETQGLDESNTQNKEQDQLSDYFKRLTDIIQKFDEVLLFGPTNAKTELFNQLNKNNRIAKTNVEVKQSERMTENQMMAFVRTHFGL
ncbi:MAG TPA: hypothetical protein DHV29_02590 [Bacteroidales bacterium]|nr:MAG: hypothetical protein A2W94_04790 [Bacteroidetes bacterium GWE2_42_42]HCB62129.1 hypothetical protein [Bacteroidales bacterium]HCY22357.1 hypothetical protein [Bacteroidales bacterium]